MAAERLPEPTVFVTRWGFYRSLSGWWAESNLRRKPGRRRVGANVLL